MNNENPKFELMSERTRVIIEATALEVERMEVSLSTELLKDKWGRARMNADLPIYTYTQTLLEVGVDEAHIRNLMGLIRDLEIDVSDPHTSSSELSIIAGVLSEDLLGVDLSEHRRQMDRVKLIPINIQGDLFQPVPPNVVYTDSEGLQYQNIARLRKWQRELITSKRNYMEISRQILEHNNQALEVVTRGHLRKF